jgi:glutaredoxin
MQTETAAWSGTPTADTWQTVGTMNVPAGVKRLVRVKFGTTMDPAAAVIARVVPVFRLMGSGLSEQSPHEFVGESGGVTNIAANGAALSLNNSAYDVDIPVMTGGQYLIQVNFLDEGAVPCTVKAEVAYDNNSPTRKNSMSQYVDAAQATAADAWQQVGSITVPQLAAGNNPSKIREIIMAHGLDMANAGTLRASCRFRLSGSGIAEGGSHEYIGANQGSNVTAAATEAFDKGTVRQITDIPVNPGGTILVEQLLDSELPTAGTVAVGLAYE